MNGSSRVPSSTTTLVAVVAVVALGLGVDALVDGRRDVAPRADVVALHAGASTCAAVELSDDGLVTAMSIAQPGADGSAPWAEIHMDRAGIVSAIGTPDVTGRPSVADVTGDAGSVGISARWESAPLLLSRRWEVGPSARVPGAVEGPCPAGVSDRWLVPGVATAGGAAARLHLANPTETAAAVGVTFTTPTGQIAPTRLANLVVPAHGRTTIDLNEFAPEEPDLGVEVLARNGSLVVEAEQTLEAAVGGVDGRSLVAATAAPAEAWTIPWVAARDGESAWIWVTNPTDDPTDVGIVIHTAEGPVVPISGGVTLGPQTTQRIDLRGALAEVGVAAVTVRSTTDVPIVASGAVLRVVEDDAVRGGIAVLEGAAGEGGLHAAMAATGAPGRSHLLAVANPTDEPATVTVTVLGAASAATAVAVDLVLPAGSSTVLDLTEHRPEEGAFAITVDVTDGIAVSSLISSSQQGPLELTAAVARPFPSTTPTIDLEVRYDRALLHPTVGPDRAS